MASPNRIGFQHNTWLCGDATGDKTFSACVSAQAQPQIFLLPLWK
jgi:hypothetical protein